MKWQYYATSGDFFRILSQEIRDHDGFEKGIDNGYMTVSEMIEALEKEEESTDQPIHRAIEKVHKYLEDTFDTPQDIVDVLREYAKRNKMMHCGAKALADAGKFVNLHQMIRKRRETLPLQGYPPEYENRFRKVLDQVEKSFYAHVKGNDFLLRHKAQLKYEQYLVGAKDPKVKELSKADLRKLQRQSESMEQAAAQAHEASKTSNTTNQYETLKIMIDDYSASTSTEALNVLFDKVDDLKLEWETQQEQTCKLEKALVLEQKRSSDLKKIQGEIRDDAKRANAKLKEEAKAEEKRRMAAEQALRRLKRRHGIKD
jgi:hypothetical protein